MPNTNPQPTNKETTIELVRDVVDRRAGLERRQQTAEEAGYDGPDQRVESRRTGLERRRGAGIRREDERRSAEEGEMTAEQFEFVMAIETYKKVNRKLFPTWTEVLEVIEQLGYKKVEARTLRLDNVPEAPLQKVA
ncbi:MAG: hypothetical protein JWM57_1459 [Phycisphaerales bacterium]|nr:hypothetical protein [Phycisphaerales bacterium]